MMPKILLLHGALGSQDNFIALKKKLSDTFEVHTLNLGGHGGTAMPDKLTISYFAKEVLAFLDQNNIDKTNIFGYSMGGYVGLYIAKNFF